MPITIIPGSKCAFYARVSTQKQDFDTQLSGVMKFAKNNNLIIEDHYVDKMSAVKTPLLQRRSLIKLLNEIQEKKYEYIVVFERSRLARNAMEHAELRTFFRHAGIPVIISSDQSFYDTDDKFANLIKDATTRLEVALNSTRTREAHEDLTEKGIILGGKAPFGYKYSTTTKGKHSDFYEIVAEEEIMVRQVFDYYKKGFGFDAIAKKMPTKSYRGSNWRDYHVKNMITTPVYMGMTGMYIRKPNARATPNVRANWVLGKSDRIPAIIETHNWEYCYGLYIQRIEGLMSHKDYTSEFLLSKLIFCKQCHSNPQLITKDQRTGKGAKKYGHLVYKCPTCTISIHNKKIEHQVQYQVINKMLVDGVYGSPENIFQDVVKGNKNSVQIHRKDIAKLEVVNEQNQLKIVKINTKTSLLRSREYTEESKKLLHLMQNYKCHIEDKIKVNLDLIQERLYQIDFIEIVLSNFELWNELFTQLFKNSDASSFQERRLILLLIDRIDIWESVDAEGNKELQYDLKTKINLETPYHLDIDFDPDPVLYHHWE